MGKATDLLNKVLKLEEKLLKTLLNRMMGLANVGRHAQIKAAQGVAGRVVAQSDGKENEKSTP